MSNQCIICGRTLRTGIKYCFTHRSMSREKNDSPKRNDNGIMIAGILGLVALIGVLFYLLIKFSIWAVNFIIETLISMWQWFAINYLNLVGVILLGLIWILIFYKIYSFVISKIGRPNEPMPINEVNA